MAYIDFLEAHHKKTKRDYFARMNKEKATHMEIAKRFDHEYWDGDRDVGYGGYHYDGRWASVAKALIDYYGLNEQSAILDVGCGKGFLLYEIKQLLPSCEIKGIDLSEYAISNAKPEIAASLSTGNVVELPFEAGRFNLVIALNVLHNLYCDQLVKALQEIERVSKKDKYVVVETYYSEQEKVNLMCWVLTGECFFAPREWEYFFKLADYKGDHSYITFS